MTTGTPPTIVRVFRLGVVTLDGDWLSLRNRTGGSARYQLLSAEARERWRAHLLRDDGSPTTLRDDPPEPSPLPSPPSPPMPPMPPMPPTPPVPPPKASNVLRQ